MTERDFCAWLKGFKEGIASKPTIKQWKRITETLGTTQGAPGTQAAKQAPRRNR